MHIPQNRSIIKPLWSLAFFMLLFVRPTEILAQTEISWNVLADVSFKEKYDEETQLYWLTPVFGQQPKAQEGKRVVLNGYFIPLEPESGIYVLSRYPYSACFFCGGAGPETVVELQLSKKLTHHIRMDEQVSFEGILKLNSTEFDHCNYILQEAAHLKNSN